ncbi:MAG: DNA polymerase III (beta subunit) [Parcubacteria group bacterium Gr01-1014_66]|nr:MAG: DNA polymerase III (beta subunit) [Parcubacteria group bacterium Gr01-1014_66]
MEFACRMTQLEHALSIAERFTGKAATLPMLGNVCLVAGPHTLAIVATNLEHAVELRISGTGHKEGMVAVPSKILFSTIQALKGAETVTLKEKNMGIAIATDRWHTQIHGVNAEDFPLIPSVAVKERFHMTTGMLKQGLDTVLPAVALSEFKPVLAGVYVRVSPHELRLVATDSFRLAEWKHTHKENNSQFSFLLPHRIAQELARILPAGEEEIEIGVGENQARIGWGENSVITRLIEGQFPDYEAIIPNDFNTTGYIQRDALMNAVRVASLFASRLQDVTLQLQKDTLKISAKNEDVGAHEMILPFSARGGEVTLTFNYRYLLDGLAILDEPEIFLGTNSEHAPVVLRNKSNDRTTYILTPLRLS